LTFFLLCSSFRSFTKSDFAWAALLDRFSFLKPPIVPLPQSVLHSRFSRILVALNLEPAMQPAIVQPLLQEAIKPAVQPVLQHVIKTAVEEDYQRKFVPRYSRPLTQAHSAHYIFFISLFLCFFAKSFLSKFAHA
jgi:hypothetical protein